MFVLALLDHMIIVREEGASTIDYRGIFRARTVIGEDVNAALSIIDVTASVCVYKWRVVTKAL